MTEYQWNTKNLINIHIIETLLDDVLQRFVVSLNIFIVRQFIFVDSVDLVGPQTDEALRVGSAFCGGEEEALEHVGEISQVKDVVELHGGGREYLGTFGVKVEGGVDNIVTELPHGLVELVAGVL